MPEQLTANEKAQLTQTIDLFEAITEEQPTDYQSLEILKQSYAQLGMKFLVKKTSKRLANAYQLMGELSRVIREWEEIASEYPDDPDASRFLNEVENSMKLIKARRSV